MAMTVSLEAPSSAPISAVNESRTRYNPVDYKVQLTFTNTGADPLSFPGRAIVTRVLRSYRNLQTGREQVFSRGEPPSPVPRLTELQPGESWSYGLGLEYPGEILPPTGGHVPVELCASWDKKELDSAIYPPGSYDWAESFRLCRELKLEAPRP